MIKKITKKQVKQIWGENFKDENSDNIYMAGVYIFQDELKHVLTKYNEGIPDFLYNRKHVATADLLPIIKDSFDYYKKDYVDAIQDKINLMIEEYNKTI